MEGSTSANQYDYKQRTVVSGGAAGGWRIEEYRDGGIWRSRVYASRQGLELAIDRGYPIKMKRTGTEEDEQGEEEHLYILWTNADPISARHMVMMYATNSMLHGWWKAVTVIIWGNTAKLAAENAIIQASMDAARHMGVEFTACIACAVNLGVKDKLEMLDVEVVPWGTQLTKLLKEKRNLLTL